MIADYETGRRRIPACNLAAIADVLGIPVSDLLAPTGKGKRGPATKIDRLAKQIGELPKRRQQRLEGVIETLLAQEHAEMTGT